MRLGGPIFEPVSDAFQWAAATRRLGYRATYPPPDDWPASEVIATVTHHDLVIAEIPAWSNPIDPDDGERSKAVAQCMRKLARAEELGARCCVNIAGSRGRSWAAPAAENYSPETFDLIVETIRHIIDAVRPKRTYYTLETMPWICPDSPDDYLRLLRAVDRDRLAVHLDPVNMINTPRLAFNSGSFIRECFAKLGPYIKSCHVKDIQIRDELTVHLDECRPGTGLVDYRAFLRELAKLDPDTPILLEHLPGQEEYAAAAGYLRNVARAEEVSL